MTARSETKIRALRNQLGGQYLAGVGEVEGVLGVLDWVCDRLVPDQTVLDVIDGCTERDDPEDLRVDDILAALADTVAPSNLAAVGLYLSRVAPTELDELAVAARKIDRLCKAEKKRRGVTTL